MMEIEFSNSYSVTPKDDSQQVHGTNNVLTAPRTPLLRPATLVCYTKVEHADWIPNNCGIANMIG